MSNHTHLVLYVDDKKAQRLSDKAIVIRWHKLFKGNWLTQKFVNGWTATFTEVTTATDPDMQVAWRVGFNGNPNEIHYTRNISAWKAAPYTKRPGDEAQSATLGSLIAHEFGHTKSGLAAIGIRSNTYKRSIDEPRASALFENAYRAKYNMPIKRTYAVEKRRIEF